jgi:hypothetical protein
MTQKMRHWVKLYLIAMAAGVVLGALTVLDPMGMLVRAVAGGL